MRDRAIWKRPRRSGARLVLPDLRSPESIRDRRVVLSVIRLGEPRLDDCRAGDEGGRSYVVARLWRYRGKARQPHGLKRFDPDTSTTLRRSASLKGHMRNCIAGNGDVTVMRKNVHGGEGGRWRAASCRTK